MFNLINKTILITGGTGYLGKEICKGLAQFEANIALCSRDKTKAENLSYNLKNKYGVKCLGYQADLSNISNMNNLIKSVNEDFGEINCLINNAYFGNNSNIGNMSLKHWNEGLDGTITSTVFMVEACLNSLKKTSGNVINIASMYGMVSPNPMMYKNTNVIPNPTNYGVGKAAIIHYTKNAAVFLAGQKIRMNSISPGPFPNKDVQKNKLFIKKISKKVPMGRIGLPKEIVGSVIFLASDASSYITGHNLVVDGGWTCW